LQKRLEDAWIGYVSLVQKTIGIYIGWEQSQSVDAFELVVIASWTCP